MVSVEGFSGEAVVGTLAHGLAAHLGIKSSINPLLQTLVYSGSKYSMLEVAELCFDGVSGFSAGSTVGFSICQLKVKIIIQEVPSCFFDVIIYYRRW